MSMTTSTSSANQVYLFRLEALIKDGGTAVVRNIIDQKLENVPLHKVLANERSKIFTLRGNRAIRRADYELLYPATGIPKIESIDLSLALCLLQHLKCFQFNRDYIRSTLPNSTDFSPDADLCRLQIYRSQIASMQSTTAVGETEFRMRWTEIEEVLLRLNNRVQQPVYDLREIIDRSKYFPLGVADNMEREEHIVGRNTSLKRRIEMKTQRSPKDTCIFDGRPIILEDDDMDCLDKSLKWFARGGFGDIYKGEELFDIPVAVKKIKTENDKSMLDITTSEMMVSRIRYQFILPLLATCCRKGEYWFISPYCENGDLAKAIPEDINKTPNELDVRRRINIVFQLAKAIEYLHTPVKNVRMEGKINCLLNTDSRADPGIGEFFLARYACKDFGIAREKNDLTNKGCGRDAYAHPGVGKTRACESWDYFSLGVVIRELLTSLGPNGHNNKYLKHMSPKEITQKLEMPFVNNNMAQVLNQLSTDCLKAENVEHFETVLGTLQDFVRQSGLKEDLDAEKCHLCMINPKGYGWGALLVAGDDTKNPTVAKAFCNDVINFKKLIASKAPLIMGISEDNIQTVVPDKKQSLSQKMMQAIECLSSRDLQTLIIYITCHGENRNDTKDNFNFRLSETDTVTLKEFEDALGQCKEKLDQLNKVMLFFDCCHPPEEVNIKGIAKANVIQLNACEDYQKAHSTNEGSIFTKFLIQGLKAKAEGSTCGENECTSCKKYWDLRTDYVTVERLLEYINDHIDTRQRPRLLFSGNHDDFKIAFYTGEEVVIEFTVVNSEEKQTIKLKHFKDMEQIETQLYEKFHRNKDDFDIVITSRTFRTDNTTEICSSAEKVVLAWVNRQPIQVSFKPKCKANSTADTGTSTTSTMVLYERRNAAEGKCSIPESGTP